MNDSPYKPIGMSLQLVSHNETKEWGIEFRFPVDCKFIVMSRNEALRTVKRLMELIVNGDAHKVTWAPDPPRSPVDHEAAGCPEHNSV